MCAAYCFPVLVLHACVGTLHAQVCVCVSVYCIRVCAVFCMSACGVQERRLYLQVLGCGHGHPICVYMIWTYMIHYLWVLYLYLCICVHLWA